MSRLRETSIKVARLLLIWSVPGTISFFQGLLIYPGMGIEVSPFQNAMIAYASWWFWVLFTPMIIALGHRFDARLLRNILTVHGPLSIVFGIFFLVWSAILTHTLVPAWPLPLVATLSNEILFIHLVVLIYWAVLGVSYAVEYNKKYLLEKSVTHQLHAEKRELDLHLAEARLMALQAQLHPHFLFNTLNAVSALMSSDVNLARKMLADLSDLLRSVLEYGNIDLVPFSQELVWLKQFLALEAIRFGDRLSIKYDIADNVHNIMVPPFLLQPLAENAIRHGIEKLSSAGAIVVTAQLTPENLTIEIKDDGPGPLASFSNGIGLTNTIERLQTLYGDKAAFNLESLNHHGGRALITIPLGSKNDEFRPD